MSAKKLVTATINGEETQFLCESRDSLLHCLRETLGMTGTKSGCNDGNCGACSVLLDGRLVNACLVLGVEVEGREVMTVEGRGKCKTRKPALSSRQQYRLLYSDE